MQKSKLLFAACFAAASLSLPTAHAEDTPAQAAARLALAQKLFQLSAGTNAPATTTNVAVKAAKTETVKTVKETKSNWSAVKPAEPVVVVNPAAVRVTTNAPAVAVKPVAPAKPVAVYVKPTKPTEVAVPSATSTGDNPAQAAARQALVKYVTAPVNSTAAPAAPAKPVQPVQAAPVTMGVVKPVQQPVVQPVVKPITIVTSAPAKPVVAPVATVAPTVTTVTTPNNNGDTPAQAAAREALAKYMFEGTTSQPAAEAKPTVITSIPVTQPEVQAEAQPAAVATHAHIVVVPVTAPAVQLQAIAAPVTPAPETRDEKLKALLAKYKTDQITPEEYHRQRAELMAKH